MAALFPTIARKSIRLTLRLFLEPGDKGPIKMRERLEEALNDPNNPLYKALENELGWTGRFTATGCSGDFWI